MEMSPRYASNLKRKGGLDYQVHQHWRGRSHSIFHIATASLPRNDEISIITDLRTGAMTPQSLLIVGSTDGSRQALSRLGCVELHLESTAYDSNRQSKVTKDLTGVSCHQTDGEV